MRVAGFHHLAIQVYDLERALAFYRDLLGLPEKARHRREDGSLRSVWVALPEDAFLALEHAENRPAEVPFRDGRPGLHLLAFRIERAARKTLVQALRAAGHPPVHETRWTFYVRDPEGNRIAFSHHPEEPLV